MADVTNGLEARIALGGSSDLRRFAPALASIIVFGIFCTALPPVAAGETFRFVWPWIPALGIDLSFVVDGLALTFALLITGIGALVLLYTAAYFQKHPGLWRLLTLLGLFELSMLGLVLADNLIVMFVFWELTTITSFLLVGFDHDKADARAKALQALLVTAAGGLVLLAGLILLGALAGTYEASALPALGDMTRGDPMYVVVFALVFVGAMTKSALIPFHFWLPNAMAAPTPVSAYLHSATMVKAGIYLLARLMPALGGTELWFWTLTLFGGTTAVLASVWALRQSDMKLALAHTTVMALGTLAMFLGGGTVYALAGAAAFLVVHAFYKASLFLVVGIIDKQTGTRRIEELGGLGRRMKLTWAITLLAALSMAGVPPLMGFIAKELQYEAALGAASSPFLVAGFAMAANAMMVAIAANIALRPFLGRTTEATAAASEPPFAMWIGPAVLALGGLLFGLFPDVLGDFLVEPTISAKAGEPTEITLKLWHGINVPLMMSVVTLAGGGIIFFAATAIRKRLAAAEAGGLWDAERGYDRALGGLKATAMWQTQLIQNGRLVHYVWWTLVSFAVLLWSAIVIGGGIGVPTLPSLAVVEWALLGLIAFAAVAVPLTQSRTTALLSLGILGAGIALLFVLYGAVDVAITQLLVETLVVVLIAVALLRLPRLRLPRGSAAPGVAWGRLGLSALVGTGVGVGLLAVLATPFDRTITDFYDAASVPDAFGRNVVNVILVDFRALDTYGEIAVVVFAALGALALLRVKPAKEPSGDQA
ncbi:MAG: hydrogen gas-evolving membrane-bound hydrogenase subunit E [Pseudomonadota bacterium]